jgi:hypothetical protein
MPKRMISDLICTSESNARLSFGAELLHYHLITQVDDYGRFFGNTELVRAACFPLRLDTISAVDIAQWISELVAVGTLIVYDIAGRQYLAYVNWLDYNRPRAESSKFPAPPETIMAGDSMQAHDSMCKHLRADSAVVGDVVVVEDEAVSGVEAVAADVPAPAAAAPARQAKPAPRPATNHREFWTAYEQDIGLLSKTIADDANDLLDNLELAGAPAEWAIQAVAEAVAQNKRSWAYVRAILARCLADKKPPGTRPKAGGKSAPTHLPPAQAAARIVEEARRG